jgi:NAD(P)H-dependent flavin oxidoreductase YrpB (nitropropane dioxygenase family)
MLSTELTKRLGIEHPIVQAGMGDAAGRDLAAAVSSAGGLGTIGTIGRSVEQTQEEIAATGAMTDRPFAVNIICFDWAPWAKDILTATIEARAPSITLSFGDPGPGLAQCKAAGIPTLVQVQDTDTLRTAIDGGADCIIVQGHEGGGHTGYRGTLNFVAQALDLAGGIPIIAAGGVGNGRGLAAALAMGCAGVVMGTRFKATPEYRGNDREKQEIVESDGSNTVYDFILDEAFGLQWANEITGRALRSPFTEEWEGRRMELREKVASYPRWGFVMELAEKGQAINWAGESSGLVDRVRPAGEIVWETVAEAEELLGRAQALIARGAAVGQATHR